MGRHGLPKNTRDKILEFHSQGKKLRPIARELGITRLRVERVVYPDRLKNRDRKHRKPNARIIRLDLEEPPEGNFDLYEGGRDDWLTG